MALNHTQKLNEYQTERNLVQATLETHIYHSREQKMEYLSFSVAGERILAEATKRDYRITLHDRRRDKSEPGMCVTFRPNQLANLDIQYESQMTASAPK